ncbi:hypothetical protein NN561_015884 [Cricetulus griseus]
MEAPLPPRESARWVAGRSRDVRVDPAGVRRAAELLLPAASAWRVQHWKELHALNPRGADEAALAWVFVVDSLNFSFWAEREERRCEVRHGGAVHTGYWALCAAVNRALDRASVVEDQKGIIPRAIQEIFQSISENPSIDFKIKVSYIEVYKEDLRDLLELETSMKDLHIREDDKGNTVIVGAKECQVESADEVMSLLESGNAARHTSTTQMNEHSSRSHAIFTISIYQAEKSTEAAENGEWHSHRHIVSKFHFVDLAGSERVTKTGNTGERFKESIQINSGLLALGNVISALGDPRRKSAHIPYRDAKITRLLKDSLGGSAKTVMITCVSPSSADFDESLNSLKYANRARNIRNKPTLNFSPESDRMDEMEFEIKLLREALQSHQASISQTSQTPSEGSSDQNRIHSLEEQVAQLQEECLGYQDCIEQAFTFLVDLKDAVRLNQKQQHKLQEWFSRTQEVRKSVLTPFPGHQGVGNLEEGPQHVTVLQLKRELKKYQCAVAADQVMLTQKELEVEELRNQVQLMVQENKGHAVSLKEAQKANRLQSLPFTVVKSQAMWRKAGLVVGNHSPSLSNNAKSVSRQYSLKVTKLEHEAEQARVELTETRKQLQELERKDLSDVALKVKLQKEFRRKMDAAKLRVQVLQKKHQDSKKLASLSIQSEKRASELEQSVGHLKNQKVQLQRRLREESEKKKHLDAELKRDQQKIKKLDEQKKWLDEEVEKVLNQRQELEQLEEELKKREAIVSKKEALLQEKSHLENKRLRSSQDLSTDSLKISARLNLLEQELSDKSLKLESSTTEEKMKISEQVQALQKERDQLQRQRNAVDEKLASGRVLSPKEEHLLFQLEEGIEALEAAIEFKSESIQNRQDSLRASMQSLSRSEAEVLEKLVCLNITEIRAILFKYFNKVINLREAERKLQLQNKEMKMKVLERDSLVHELESALEHLRLQCDRRLTLQQKEQEQRLQLLLHHFRARDAGDGVPNPEEAAGLAGEPKWASGTENAKLNGREREVEDSSSSLKTAALAPQVLEGSPEAALPVGGSLAPPSGRVLSNADNPEERPVPHSQSPPPSQFQPGKDPGQLQGVKPVKLCRRELRQISALELSLRRSSVGAGVLSVTADSLEAPEETNDSKA